MEMLSADMLMMTAQYETPDVASILPSLLERIVNNAGQGHPAVDDFIPNTTGYTAFEINTYDIVIDGEASPDTFKWRKNSEAYTEGVPVDDADVTLTDGIKVKWLALTGHTVGDTWRIRMKPKAIIYIDDQGKRQMIRHDGSIVAFDTDPTFGDITADSLTVDDITAANPIQGDVTGNVTGNITGNVTGNVTGNLTGNVTGNVTGDVTGNSAGTHTGPVAATTSVASIGHQDLETNCTATPDGSGSGTIGPGVRKVSVVNSIDANDILKLPVPVIGYEVDIFVGSNCELRTSDPETISLNGVSGAGKELAMAAGETFVVKCISGTAYIAYKIGADGTPAAGGTPD